MQLFARTVAVTVGAAVIGWSALAWAQDKPAGDKPAGGKPAAKETTATTAEVGKTAPDFELKGIDGKTVKFSDLKDKVVVLEWFNMECPVCVKRMPVMEETSAKYAKQGVVWLAVDSTNFRKVEENAAFAKDKKIAYPILMDNDGKVGKAYGAKTTPHMFVINKGKLVYAGAIDDGNASEAGKKNYVAEALDSVLAGKEVATGTTKPYGCSVKYKKD